MVISKKHKYCFVEYPRSASYAIRLELLEYYDGESWLNKHSKYSDFVKSFPDTYKNYFVFCSIRNPLTDIVSIYNINKNNSSGRATEEFWKRQPWFVKMHEARRFKYLQKNENASFQDFFRKIFILPYVKPRIIAELSDKEKYDYIIKVENLQNDFSNVLQKIGIEQVRPVPKYNVSNKNKKSITIDEYYPEDLRNRAVMILSPMMKHMNYNFPEHWNVKKYPFVSFLYFNIIKWLAIFYWKYIV